MMSNVQCPFRFEICTTEGRGGEKGRSVNFKTKHTEPLTQEISCPLCTKSANALYRLLIHQTFQSSFQISRAQFDQNKSV